MIPNLTALELELQRFPTSVSEEFRRAAERMPAQLRESDLLAWANLGLEVARQTVRSWEAASEYFRVSPEVVTHLSPVQLLEWGRCGSDLCQESPTLAIAFFHGSPASIQHLHPRFIRGWSKLGSTLYRGTWKSSALAAKFFEASAPLLEHMSFQELEQFAELVEALSHKSADLATECLVLGQQGLPRMEADRPAFIRLYKAVAENNWREVKGCLEVVPRALTQVGADHRSRFLDIATVLAQAGTANISPFVAESAGSLGRVDDSLHGSFLDMAETLLPLSHEAVAAFLRGGPGLLSRISQQQLTTWFETGLGILRENQDGGLAYFRVESNTSERVLEALSSAVELDRIRGILELYCQALAGTEVDIATTKDLKAKNIGWVSEEHATTEGSSVYLPAVVQAYGSKAENFDLFKVVSTHQVAHIEFDSFQFSFETPAARFSNLRPAREQEAKQRRLASAVSLPADGHEQEASAGMETLQVHLLAGAAPETPQPFITDTGRFFQLFKHRKLAVDVFTVMEDGRLDYRVKVDYPGVASAYRRVQADAIATRPRIEEMPLQEAMVEFLVRLSLLQSKKLPYPVNFKLQAKAMAQVARRLLSVKATVEDSAEATIRIYDIIATMPNVELPEEEWEKEDFDQEEMSEQELEALLDQLQAQATPEGSADDEEQQPYDSPPPVDFRGDFKPQLTQLLSKLRQRKGQQGDQQGGGEISREMLQQLLANSEELELDAEGGEYNQELAQYVQNMLREAGGTPPPEPGHGYGPIPHEEDTGGSLEAKEPRSFVYDEWDFRAADYKPRWCVVREKSMAEGDPLFYTETLHNYSGLVKQIRRHFEMLKPEMFRKIKHLPDGDDFDLDAVVEAIIDKWAGESPSEKVHWRRNKVERDAAAVFLMDMSASTAEAIDESRRLDDWDAPTDPVEYMVWLRQRRAEGQRRSYKRIIDLEKESTVLLINAMETIGDVYGIYGFSGYGRENVEFYVIKDVDEKLSDSVKRRIDKITPLHATRMGPAIRHATSKLSKQDARTKLLFLISDGRPQDRGYSREGVEKEYAVHDTKMALAEARRLNITPFCLTVDKAGHDYLKTMCQDMGYEVLADINALPSRLPMLYRKLTL